MYTPNIKDKRVQARIRKALGWAQATLSTYKEKQVPQSTITKHLGQQQDNLARWLRKRLLQVADNHYSMDHGVCKSYFLNADGCDELKQLIGISTKQVTTEYVEQQFKEQLETGQFEYKDKSNRLWNPLQSIKSEVRNEVLSNHNFTHNYDIQCSAPTLIYQHALKCGLEKSCPTIKEYINNRQRIRQQLATATNLSNSIIKEVLNAKFAGAQLGLNRKSDLYKLIRDEQKIKALREHSTMIKLTKEIKMCWDAIKPSLNLSARLTAKDKWTCYFSLERTVLEAVREYLEMSKTKYLLIHDGWVTETEVDTNLLENFVKQITDYEVVIAYENLRPHLL